MLKRGTLVIATRDICDNITRGEYYTILEDAGSGAIKVRDDDQNHYYLCPADYELAVELVETPGTRMINEREQFVLDHAKVCDSLKEITARKNSDYTGNTQDPFANFRQVETFNICTTEQGFLTRMTDKMSRIASLIGQGTSPKVKDESIEDTLKDLANYSILLMLYIQQNKKEKNNG